MKTRIQWLLLVLLGLILAPAAQAYYNPSTGRWLSRDPVLEKGFKQVSNHSRPSLSTHRSACELYVFIKANPVSEFDVLGLQAASTAQRPDFSCCDAQTVGEGRKQLMDRYNAAKDYLEEMGAPHNGSPIGPTACLSFATYLHKFMRPFPNCWTCWVECRREALNPFKETWDENAVVCQSHPKSGPPDKIVFDYFANRPAGENYDGWYQREHPVLKDEGAKTWDADCQGKCRPKSDRRPYDWTILDTLLDEIEKDKQKSAAN